MSIKRNAAWNLVGMGVPLLFGAAAIPYLLRNVGVEALGILTLVWALIGYFSLFDFGLGRALTQQVAVCRASSDQKDLPILVKTGLLFTAWAGVGGGTLLAAAVYFSGVDLLNVSANLRASVFNALLIAAVGIPLTTITTGLRGVLEAYEDFKTVNALRILLGVANFGGPVLCVAFISPSLEAMIASLVLSRLIVMVAHLHLMNRRLPAGWKQVPFNRKKLRELFSFGAWMTVSNIVGPLMVSADRFIISSMLGAAVVAYYTVPSEVMARVLILPAALTGALFPRFSMLLTSDADAARRLYKSSLFIVAGVMLPVCLILAVLSHWGLTLWLGKDFADQSWVIAVVLALGIALNSVAFVPFSVIQAAGNSFVTAKIHLIELIFYIPLIIFSLKKFGLVGAAAVWTLRVGVDLIALLYVARKSGTAAYQAGR
ncbi:flippase [Variovorax sp. LT1R16]|uniref:flippase n=1 Tax=Variovorax sp. LT1R16 TaxID=3443728 RepID=UPI003F456FC5